jgi:hypothetical protein
LIARHLPAHEGKNSLSANPVRNTAVKQSCGRTLMQATSGHEKKRQGIFRIGRFHPSKTTVDAREPSRSLADARPILTGA